jgi:hypothetical protein
LTEENKEEIRPEDNILLQLRQSYLKRGSLHSVIRDQNGRIISGETRKKAVPNWPEKVIVVEDDVDFHLKKISDNVHAAKDEAWWHTQINDTAQALVAKEKTERGKVAKRLAELLEVSYGRIVELLDPQYKDEVMQGRGSKGGKAKSRKGVLHKDITKQNGATQSVAEGTTEAIENITPKKSSGQGSKTPKTESNPVADFTSMLSEIKVYPEKSVTFQPGPEEVLLPKKKQKPYTVDFLIGNIGVQVDKKIVFNRVKEDGLWNNHGIKVLHLPIRLIYGKDRDTLKNLMDAFLNYWNPSASGFRDFRKSD